MLLAILILLITVIASLVSPAGKAQTAVNNARRHANAYLDRPELRAHRELEARATTGKVVLV